MPFSKEKNILFIHIPKCAGKSFEVALGIATIEEVTKYKWRSFFNKASKYFLNLTKDRKSMERVWGVCDISLTLQHLTYSEIELLNILSKSELDNAIKVAIVRNPYDRAVSSYKHMGSSFSDFEDFLNNYYKSKNRNHNDLAHKRQQVDFLRDKKGNVVIDNIIRFESLESEMEDFLINNGVQIKSVPHIGKQHRNEDYRSYYNPNTRKIVEELFNDDITHLNYFF